jgi:hypothetical protein
LTAGFGATAPFLSSLGLSLAIFERSSAARGAEHGFVLHDFMSALEHKLHATENSSKRSVSGMGRSRATGVGATVDDRVASAALFHVVPCELSGDQSKYVVGFCHDGQCAR